MSAPDVSMPDAAISNPTPVTNPTPQAPTPAAPAQPQSRLAGILGAVANTASTSLAGIPAGGRPSFLGGLGEGARSEKAAQATQQAIKFKTFDDQVRMAELHNQDLKLQNDTQEQTDAHSKAELDMRAFANEHGVNYDTISNHGPAVMEHLTAQTQANGAASVPPGTHVSADGKSIYVPQQGQATQDGQKAMYSALAPALGLPGLPPGADFVPPKMLNMLTNKVNGFDINGAPIKHEDLPGMLSATQTQRDTLAKNGASDSQLKTLDNMIGIYKANLNGLDAHAAKVAGDNAQATKAGQIAAETSPDAVKGEQGKAAGIKQAQLDVENSPNNQAAAARGAATKTTAELNAKNNGSWNNNVGADEKKKAELAENIAFNANEVAKMVMKRPDILGSVAGRFTSAQQMIGNNDPDISALGVHIHNMAMANSGVHGFRSQEGVESYERQLLNNFKNGPAAMAGALRASTGSVQTFIDNARPEGYKTHSKQGGAVRGMLGGQ